MYAFAQVLPEMNLSVSPAMNLMIGAAFEIPGAVLAIAVGMVLSRKASAIISLVGILVSTVLFAWGASLITSKKDASFWVEVALQIGLFSFKTFSAMLFGLVYTYSAEVYPTVSRAMGSGFCITVGRLGAIVSPPIYEYLYEWTHSFMAFVYVMMAICAIDIVLIAFLPYETKGAALKDYVDEIEPIKDNARG